MAGQTDEELANKDLDSRMDEVIVSANEYIERFVPSLGALVRTLRGTPGVTSGTAVYNACEGFMWLAQALSLTARVAGIEPETGTVNGIVKAVFYGLENGDYDCIADAFEYEGLPLAERWRSGLLRIKE